MKDNYLILCLFLALTMAVPARADDAAQPPVTNIAAPATAATSTTDDPVQALITQQLNAIRARDADQAFAHTTSTFHDHYNTAQNFLSHMRFEYRPLYNHKTFSFLDRHEIQGGGVLQKVTVEDNYGTGPVTVIFRLQQQEDGQWLIDSFTLLNADDDAKPI